ncbi:hypothetical protein ACFWJT_04495, partial [Streptomyces sp. NPDC127069]
LIQACMWPRCAPGNRRGGRGVPPGGGPRPAAVLDALDAVQSREAARIERLGGRGQEPWAAFLARGDAEEMRAERSWLRSNRTLLLGTPDA